MKTAIHHSTEARQGAHAAEFPPLELETRPAVATDACAFYLSRRPQTLRGWACSGAGPLRPIRIHGRLAWKTADIRALLGVEV